MKAEVISVSKENVGGEKPATKLLVLCGPTPEDPSLRQLNFTVDWTPENRAKYAAGAVVELDL